jgi:hypothetical protein
MKRPIIGTDCVPTRKILFVSAKWIARSAALLVIACRDDLKKWVNCDTKEINRLSMLGVRKNPFIAVTPKRTVICVAAEIGEWRPLAKFVKWRLNYCLQEWPFR